MDAVAWVYEELDFSQKLKERVFYLSLEVSDVMSHSRGRDHETVLFAAF